MSLANHRIRSSTTSMALFCRSTAPPRWQPSPRPTLRRLQAQPNEKPDPDESDPLVIFPPRMWVWQRADAKTMLPEAQKPTAAAWILNVIEALHWASFPLGLYIAHSIFTNTSQIAKFLPDGSSGVFWLILGLVFQIFGGGTANLMHAYEGWQVTPFRNLLTLAASPTPAQVDAIRVCNANNQWLRTVTYQFLFTFQSIGLACFNVAVFGANTWTLGAIGLAAIVGLVGPFEPRTNFTRKVDNEKRSLLPLSWALVGIFAVIATCNLWANVSLFAPVVAASAWPPTLAPWLEFIPANVGGWLSALAAPVLTAAGGVYEGLVAETSFNQWDHLIAFVMLLGGLGLTGALYWHLAHAAPAF
eukprot:jgi/Ulvmu1/11013/UM007_0193.1